MYLSDTLGVLLRRWLLVAVGFLLTGTAGFWVVGQVGSDFQASGQLVLLLPAEATGNVPTNPYLNLQGGLSVVGALVATSVTTQAAQASFAAQGYTAEYDLALAPGTGPVMLVTAKSKDPGLAVSTRDAVMAQVQRALTDLQKDRGIPESQIITAQPSIVPPEADVLPGSRLRALVGTVGAGTLLVLVASFTFDRFLAGRRPRRRPKREGPAPDGGATRADGVLVGGP